MFRINSHTLTSQASSEKVSYIIQRKIKDKAITAGIVGGILFFIVAIILAVCTVKCVNKRNKRRRREQENGISSYNIFHHQYVDTNDFAKKKKRSNHFASLTSGNISLIHYYFCMIQHMCSLQHGGLSDVSRYSKRLSIGPCQVSAFQKVSFVLICFFYLSLKENKQTNKKLLKICETLKLLRLTSSVQLIDFLFLLRENDLVREVLKCE